MSDLNLEIKQLIVEALGLEDMAPEEIGDEASLFGDGLGLDSIDALELGVALRKKYLIRLETGDSAVRDAFRCVSSLAALVQARRAPA